MFIQQTGPYKGEGNKFKSQSFSEIPHNMSDVGDIKKKLRELFNYYSSYGDRLNVNNLKSNKFHKMMVDA